MKKTSYKLFKLKVDSTLLQLSEKKAKKLGITLNEIIILFLIKFCLTGEVDE